VFLPRGTPITRTMFSRIPQSASHVSHKKPPLRVHDRFASLSSLLPSVLDAALLPSASSFFVVLLSVLLPQNTRETFSLSSLSRNAVSLNNRLTQQSCTRTRGNNFRKLNAFPSKEKCLCASEQSSSFKTRAWSPKVSYKIFLNIRHVSASRAHMCYINDYEN